MDRTALLSNLGAIGSALASGTPAAELATIEFRVEGMTCGGCVLDTDRIAAAIEGAGFTPRLARTSRGS